MVVGESQERKQDRRESSRSSMYPATRARSVSHTDSVYHTYLSDAITGFRGVLSQALVSQPKFTISIRSQKFRLNQLLNEA